MKLCSPPAGIPCQLPPCRMSSGPFLRVVHRAVRQLESRAAGLSARFFPSRSSRFSRFGHGDMSNPAEQDLALARAARGGDPESVARLADRLACVPGVVRSMHGRLGHPLREEELDEVVQETLAALWAKLERFDGRSALETWAYGFCGTQLIKFLERKRRRSNLSYGLRTEDLSGAAERDEQLSRLEFEWVHAALERLGPPADDVVRLKHFEELTFEEIGQRLSISPNTAKTHYYRALERLREALAPLWRVEQEETR